MAAGEASLDWRLRAARCVVGARLVRKENVAAGDARSDVERGLAADELERRARADPGQVRDEVQRAPVALEQHT